MVKITVLIVFWIVLFLVFHTTNRRYSIKPKPMTDFQKECERMAFHDTLGAVAGYIAVMAPNIKPPDEWLWAPLYFWLFIGFALFHQIAYRLRIKFNYLK